MCVYIYKHVYIYIYIYIYTYICILTGLQVLKFLCKPSFTMLCSSLKYVGIFSPKRATKKALHGRDFRKKIMGRVHGETNDQIISR